MEEEKVVISAINFVANQLLDTSSSSSSDEDFVQRKPKHRITNFINNVIQHYSPKEVLLIIL